MPTDEAESRPVFRTMPRRAHGRALGGVAGGLADHLGVRVEWVRTVFLLLVLGKGVGIAIYAALWLMRPLSSEVVSEPQRSRGRFLDWTLIIVALVGLAALNSSDGAPWMLMLVVVIGAALLWRALDSSTRRGVAGWLTPSGWIWLALGAGLVITGLAVILVSQVDFSSLRTAFAAVAVTLVGTGLILLPVLAKLWRSLDAERAAHAREEERTRLAAHVHDCALQTLTLIQKQAENPREVLRLARGGERELRSWLFEPHKSADEGLHEALRRVAAQVEDDHGVRVQVVTVGESSPDLSEEGAEALVGAAREALVNAAKHAGVLDVDLYAESDARGSAVYVRDRGEGFDPAAVPEDRRGVAVSIKDRLARRGGTAEVKTHVGKGTEVRLWIPA
jgi:signal transduction histidine kinase